MSMSGLKHVATEPTRLETKRERRRGAAGRAAALRRAPSDSDCSGETASLSADSGDRSVRPAPPPPRSGKSRSRRRGSEWEVLEGLKDGQRFDKRPEVFNGYLHKKRKWPLKGWHKRFFVVDGGILVYARSPTDVARGRLHGSVDVGLSVISAKARRRRIDIDADEFIYHLRAKTPDVFRTWLNVLKAHRLYRQHLLTFGARESVPKIHAPLEDLPPTDTSSHASVLNDLSSCEEMPCIWELPKTVVCPLHIIPNFNLACRCYHDNNRNTAQKPIKTWMYNTKNNMLSSIPCDSLEDLNFSKNICDTLDTPMNCLNETYEKNIIENVCNKSLVPSLLTSYAQKIMHSTDVEFNSKSPDQISSFLGQFSMNSPIKNVCSLTYINEILQKNDFRTNKINDTCSTKHQELIKHKENAQTLFFFTRKSKNNPIVRKSKKSTNLVKYKNLYDEPLLDRPISKTMILGKHRLKCLKTNEVKNKNEDVMPKNHINIQAEVDNKEHKGLQNTLTASEYDTIAEKLMVSIYENFRKSNDINKTINIKSYLNEIVKELYDVKLDCSGVHPAKKIFRCLLEYWLNNTTSENFKQISKKSTSINTQYINHFTEDKTTSNIVITNVTKAIQFYGICDMIEQKGEPNVRVEYKGKKNKLASKVNDSFEKERRIQELERILKNTVYVCDTKRSSQSREGDIKITRKLIDNLDKFSHQNNTQRRIQETVYDISSSSNELPKIEETINNLISETSLPPDFAKEFLGAYLDLLHENDHDNNSSSEESQVNICGPKCDVEAESVQKKVSISISTNDIYTENLKLHKSRSIDRGTLYLKDVLNRIISLFSKEEKENAPKTGDIVEEWSGLKFHHSTRDELGNLRTKNCNDNSVIIDISKYDLEHISMKNESAIKVMASIKMTLKEKTPNSGEHKPINLKLKFADKTPKINLINDNRYLSDVGNSDKLFSTNNIDPCSLKQNSSLKVDCYINNGGIELKPYMSNIIDYDNDINGNNIDMKSCSSDGTSKACRPKQSLIDITNVAYRSLDDCDILFKSNRNFTQKKLTESLKNIAVDDPKSCYVFSFKKGALASKFQSQKRDAKNNGGVIKLQEEIPTCSSPNNFSEELHVLEKNPRAIDEKCILEVLENLSALSKNLPVLHKEINCLCLKLRRKLDKSHTNSKKIQGLGLLGKIYNDDSNIKSMEENGTQFDKNICPITFAPVTNNITSTSDLLIEKHGIDKAVSACTIWNKNSLKYTQHDANVIKENNVGDKIKFLHINYVPSNTQTTSLSSLSSEGEIRTTDKASSVQNWYRQICTRDCAISTFIKCILDKNPQNFKLSIEDEAPGQAVNFEKEFPINKKTKNERKQSQRLRQELIKETTLLSPSFKVSTQSQTDGKLRCLRDKNKNKNYQIYQLFVSRNSEVKKSCSMKDVTQKISKKSSDLNTIYRCSSDPSYCSGLISPTSPLRGPQAGFVSGTPGGRLAGWSIESGGPLDSVSRELGQAQLSVQQLQRLLNALELQQQAHHDTDVSLEGASPNVKKDRRKFGLRKKKSSNKCASVELAPPHMDLSNSHMALSTLTAPPSPGGGASSIPASAASLPIACVATRPQSLPGAEVLNAPASLSSLTPDHQLREDFTVLAKDLVSSLKSVVATLVRERGRARAESEGTPLLSALRTDLSSALQQNSELRSRLSRIHDVSDLAEISSMGHNSPPNRPFQHSLSYSSSCVSASEFFDAEEHEDNHKQNEMLNANEAGVIELDGDSSSEAGSLSSEDGSASSDNSEAAMVTAEQSTLRVNENGPNTWVRRTRLPHPRPSPGGPSLWNLLYKNIGKDLSQISMPVTINEPLNMLQRLCEELEYSELLDAAASSSANVERCALVAAFAVSSYAAAAHRAASKPFNPLLAETYECVRADRAFRFIAEQVSHHPPISACHAESPRWVFWQEARIKTKFWGKSMEFQPAGRVHVKLLTTGDHYSWNKVTTCVHNLFGGQRWVDQYGDMHITCHGTDIGCKLNFIKASSWSSSRHEVRGAVTEGGSGTRLRLAGRWSEALYAGDPPAARCLWRPGAMPPEHELYYGFTRFAMELNEMEPGMRDVLPHTDTRLRPDQRALEEGDVESAEQYKHQLEQAQRERRRDSPEHTPQWFRKELEGSEEMWSFTGEYWKAREAGFPSVQAPRLW